MADIKVCGCGSRPASCANTYSMKAVPMPCILSAEAYGAGTGPLRALTDCSPDLDQDGTVGRADLEALLEVWGPVPDTEVALEGNLDSAGQPAVAGSLHLSRPFYTDSALVIGHEMVGNEDLTVIGNDLYISDGAGGSTHAIEGGAQTIVTLEGARKGGRVMRTRSFVFSAVARDGVDAHGTTFNDFAAFLESGLGLDSRMVGDQTLGGKVELTAGGALAIHGNDGSVQDLSIGTKNIIARDVGHGREHPVILEGRRNADGESVFAGFSIFDSFCVTLDVELSIVLQETNENGSTAIWLAESNDADALDRIVGTGALRFDAEGRLREGAESEIRVPRGNGAASPTVARLDYGEGFTGNAGRPSDLVARPDRGPFPADLDGNGTVGVADLLILLASWTRE